MHMSATSKLGYGLQRISYQSQWILHDIAVFNTRVLHMGRQWHGTDEY